MEEGITLPTSSSSTSSTMTKTTTALYKVWRLVDMYYADCNFNGQDWDVARFNYAHQNKNNNNRMVNNATSMRASNKMIKSLGDKYTCLLNQYSYAAIQQFDQIRVGATFMPDS